MAKSAIVRGAGFAAGIWTDLVKEIEFIGGSDPDIYPLSQPQGKATLERIAEIIVGVHAKFFRATVDYRLRPSEMIRVGGYNHVDEEVSDSVVSRFVPKYGEPREAVDTIFEIFSPHLGTMVSFEQMQHKVDECGYRSATLPELLAFGARHPQVQLHYEFTGGILALGSVWYEAGVIGRYASLGVFGQGRGVHSKQCYKPIPGASRILVVKK